MVEIKYKVKYAPILFNFKTKQVEFGEEMTTEIMLNEV
jgi:hypothetical protein